MRTCLALTALAILSAPLAASGAVITLNEEGRVHTCNAAGFRLLKVREGDYIIYADRQGADGDAAAVENLEGVDEPAVHLAHPLANIVENVARPCRVSC